MSEHFNKLSPAEAERLSCLLEECGEVLQIIGKIQRHGYESYSPDDATKTTNRSLLERELGDLESSITRMCASDDIRTTAIVTWAKRKWERVKPYLHHQETK